MTVFSFQNLKNLGPSYKMDLDFFGLFRKGKTYTEDPHYNDTVCYLRFCCEVEFAVIKKLDMGPSKA